MPRLDGLLRLPVPQRSPTPPTCHGRERRLAGPSSRNPREWRSRSCGDVSPARKRACSGVSPWTCVRTSLEVRLLAPDAVDPDAAGDVANEPQHPAPPPPAAAAGCRRRTPPWRHGAPRAAGCDAPGGSTASPPRPPRSGSWRRSLDLSLWRRASVACRRSRARASQSSPRATAVRQATAVGTILVAVLPVEVGNGPQASWSLPEPAAPSMTATRPPLTVAWRIAQRLLPAQRIAVGQERLDLLPHRLLRQAVAAVVGHRCRHVLHRLLEPEVVPCGIDLGVDHPCPGLGGRLPGLQPLDLRVPPAAARWPSPSASRPISPDAALAAASTMSGRRNTASSRARWAGRSSSRSVSAPGYALGGFRPRAR